MPKIVARQVSSGGEREQKRGQEAEVQRSKLNLHSNYKASNIGTEVVLIHIEMCMECEVIEVKVEKKKKKN